MQFKIIHNNFNVSDLEKSIEFYNKAVGLFEVKRKVRDGYTIAFLANEQSTHMLELTCLVNHPQKYDLGENETHLAFRVDDYAAARKLHQQMGCICLDNTEMGLYFIEDPDGYWLEILPIRK